MYGVSHRLWIALLLASGLLADEQGHAQLTGTIKDMTETPVAETTVVLVSLDQALRTKSDANGRFDFHGLPAGEYQLEVSAPGFLKQRLYIGLQKDTVTSFPIELKIGIPDMQTCGPHSSVDYGLTPIDNPSLTGTLENFFGKKRMLKAEVSLWRTGGKGPSFSVDSD